MTESEALQPFDTPGDTVTPAPVGTRSIGAGLQWRMQFGRLALLQFFVTLLVVLLTWLSDTDLTGMRPQVPLVLDWAANLLLFPVFPVVTLVYPDLKADSGDYRYVLFFALMALNSLVWAAFIVVARRRFRRV